MTMAEEEYLELKAAPVDTDELHPRKMRRFISHLAASAIKAEERSAKKQKIKEKLERMKSVSLNKRSTKKMIEDEFGSFESVVKELIHDDEKILEEQRKETRQITELKRMVEDLSKKLIAIGREYAKEIDDRDRKILELREALAAANIKISESGEERKKKIREIERKLKQQRPAVPEPLKPKSDMIRELESHLDLLEERHKSLKEKGIHKKEDLDRIKSIIDRHKQALAEAKGERPKPEPKLRPRTKKKAASKKKAKPKKVKAKKK